MRVLIIILTIAFTVVFTYRCKDGSKTHTKEFKTHQNDPSYLFLKNTYGGKYFDKCEKYNKSPSSSDGKKKLIDNILFPMCSGPHCIADPKLKNYKCGKGNLECWQGEHIIDTKRCEDDLPDISKEDTNIMGNIVFAYGKWNNHLGNSDKAINFDEKTKIYKDIYDEARNAVIECSRPTTEVSGGLIAVGVSTISLIVIVIVVVIAWYIKKRESTSFI